MSKLIVEVCKIEEVRNHPDADRLDIVKAKGWDCVVGRDQYKQNDLVIFVPPDSILPQDVIDRWEVGYLKNKVGRVGVIKLRGVYSYGLILDNKDNLRLGTDVAETYGITKWIPPSERFSMSSGKKKGRKYRGDNPRFLKYTDIENIRNFVDVFQPGEDVCITEKIHGTNFRAGWVAKEVGPVTRWLRNLFRLGPVYEFLVGSRNVQIDDPAEKTYYDNNVYHIVATRLALTLLPKGYVVYGEIFGPGIQDLTYGRQGLDVRFFDVMHEGRYLDFLEAWNFFDEHGLEPVPVIDVRKWKEGMLDSLTFGNSSLDEHTIMEGLVIRPGKERTDSKLGRVILKVINPEYLVRKGGTENK